MENVIEYPHDHESHEHYDSYSADTPHKPRMGREKALIPETKLIEALTNEEFDACYCKAFKILSDYVYKNNVNSKYESRPDQIKAMTFANAYYKVFGSM